MLAALFNFGKAIVRKGVQWLNQKLQQWTQPTDGHAVLETVADLMGSVRFQNAYWIKAE